MIQWKNLFVILGFANCIPMATIQAQTSGNYILNTQQQRQSNRWTIQDWIDTRSVMYEQDVRNRANKFQVLSNPETDKFSPETSFEYSMTNGKVIQDGDDASEAKEFAGTQTRVQMWGTNLITQASGLRMPNLDFGLEHVSWTYAARDRLPDSVDMPSDESANALPTGTGAGLAQSPKLEIGKRSTTYTASNFRLLGSSIQDSSLLFKVGKYKSKLESRAAGSELTNLEWSGMMAGVEAQVYLIDWFGVTGSMMAFGDDVSAQGTKLENGRFSNYGVFLEMNLFRLSMAAYEDVWNFVHSEQPVSIQQKGVLGALKISL